MRRIPPQITQEELKSNKAHIDTRRTSNESVMEGDPKFTNLIESIMYDTTPVHYIIMVSEELKWVVKEKYFFNVGTGKVKKWRSLCMNFTKKYNNKMGYVGIADNPRNYYRIYFG